MYVTSLFQVLPQSISLEAIEEVETLPRAAPTNITRVTTEEHYEIQTQQRFSQQVRHTHKLFRQLPCDVFIAHCSWFFRWIWIHFLTWTPDCFLREVKARHCGLNSLRSSFVSQFSGNRNRKKKMSNMSMVFVCFCNLEDEGPMKASFLKLHDNDLVLYRHLSAAGRLNRKNSF